MTKLNILIEQTKVEAIKKAIGGGESKEDRKLFSTLEAAVAAFTAATKVDESVPNYIAPESAFFHVETDDEGNPVKDEAGNLVMTEDLIPGMSYAVAIVGARKRGADGKMEGNGVKAIVCWPMPTMDAFRESEAGKDWLNKVIEKEAAHVTFRGLRNAESLEEFESAFAAIPMSVDDIVSTHRSEGGIDTEAFDIIWPDFRALLKEKQPKIAGHLPPKQDVIKAIRSKAFAEQEYKALESMRGDGLFVAIAKKMIEAGATWKDENGESDPVDTSVIQAWIDGREELNLAPKKLDEAELADIQLTF